MGNRLEGSRGKMTVFCACVAGALALGGCNRAAPDSSANQADAGTSGGSPVAAALFAPASYKIQSQAQAASSLAPKARPSFASSPVLFEDRFLTGPADPHKPPRLVYRIEGDSASISRVPNYQSGGVLKFLGGAAAYIHPAQYESATVEIQLKVLAGEPMLAIAHNGMKDNTGRANSSPGVGVRLGAQGTSLVNLATGSTFATIAEAFPRSTLSFLRVAWDHSGRWIRVDMAGGSYTAPLPAEVTRKGGFALKSGATTPATRFEVRQARVLFEDKRALSLYDSAETIYDLNGTALGRLPPPKLPAGFNAYAMSAFDPVREKALLFMGDSTFSTDSVRAFAVRDLRTGAVTLLPAQVVKECHPSGFGGGGFDGIWLLNSGSPPNGNTCWIDWNAYARGDLASMFLVDHAASHGPNGAFVSYHDASNGLDGSLARYVRINQGYVGRTMLTVHPALRKFVSTALSADIALPSSSSTWSQTGPAGLPSSLAVRDVDHLIFEHWDFTDRNIHRQNLGYDLFAESTDWVGVAHSGDDEFESYLNTAPSILVPGRFYAQHFHENPSGPALANYAGRMFHQSAVLGNFTYTPATGKVDLVPSSVLPKNLIQFYYTGPFAAGAAPLRGNFSDANGTLFWLDGAGGTCPYASFTDYELANPNPTAIRSIQSTAGLAVGSACAIIMPAGNYRTPEGTIYYSNGAGRYCSYSTFQSYLDHGGNPNWAAGTTAVPAHPSIGSDGYCQ